MYVVANEIVIKLKKKYKVTFLVKYFAVWHNQKIDQTLKIRRYCSIKSYHKCYKKIAK